MRLRHLSALLLLVLCVNSVAQARVQLPADIDFVLSTLQTLSEQPPSVARSQEAQDLLATTLITSQYGTIDPEQNAEIGRRITAPM